MVKIFLARGAILYTRKNAKNFPRVGCDCAHTKKCQISAFFLGSALQGKKFGVLYLDSHIILTEYGSKPCSGYCVQIIYILCLLLFSNCPAGEIFLGYYIRIIDWIVDTLSWRLYFSQSFLRRLRCLRLSQRLSAPSAAASPPCFIQRFFSAPFKNDSAPCLLFSGIVQKNAP